MLRCSKWIILLALCLALVSTFLVGSSHAFASASQHASQQQQTHAAHSLTNRCTFRDPWNVVIDTNTVNYYYCGYGYTGIYDQNVYNVYNNTGGYIWIRWYQGGPGHYCTIYPYDNAQWSGNPTRVLVTQLDIGASQGPQCPKQPRI